MSSFFEKNEASSDKLSQHDNLFKFFCLTSVVGRDADGNSVPDIRRIRSEYLKNSSDDFMDAYELDDLILKNDRFNEKIDHSLLRSTYEDVMNTGGMIRLLQSHSRCDWQETIEKFRTGARSDAEVARYEMWISRCLVTNLRSLYLFADIFLATLKGELSKIGLPSNPKTWLDEPWNMAEIPLREGLCLKTYRDILVAHHEIAKTVSTQGNKNGLCLFPCNLATSIENDDRASLEHLFEKYRHLDEDLLKKRGPLAGIDDNISSLFYAIPLRWEEKDNHDDRKSIEALASKFGCKSRTADEVLNILSEITRHLFSKISGNSTGRDELAAS